MGDAQVDTAVSGGPLRSRAHVVAGPTGSRLPLAAARNQAAALAFGELGAELVVFLDVDCLPGADLLAAYAEAHAPFLGDKPATP
jgi:hypothetical protein